MELAPEPAVEAPAAEPATEAESEPIQEPEAEPMDIFADEPVKVAEPAEEAAQIPAPASPERKPEEPKVSAPSETARVETPAPVSAPVFVTPPVNRPTFSFGAFASGPVVPRAAPSVGFGLASAGSSPPGESENASGEPAKPTFGFGFAPKPALGASGFGGSGFGGSGFGFGAQAGPTPAPAPATPSPVPTTVAPAPATPALATPAPAQATPAPAPATRAAFAPATPSPVRATPAPAVATPAPVVATPAPAPVVATPASAPAVKSVAPTPAPAPTFTFGRASAQAPEISATATPVAPLPTFASATATPVPAAVPTFTFGAAASVAAPATPALPVSEPMVIDEEQQETSTPSEPVTPARARAIETATTEAQTPTPSLSLSQQAAISIRPHSPPAIPPDHPLMSIASLLQIPQPAARSLYGLSQSHAELSAIWEAVDRFVKLGEEGRRAAVQARELENEQRAHVFESRFRELQSKLARAEDEKKELAKEVADKESNLARLRADLSRTGAAAEGAGGTIASLQQRVAVLESENRDLASVVERRGREAEGFRADADRASQATAELRNRLLDAETRLLDAQGAELQSRYAKEAAEKEARESKATVDWLRGEQDRERESWSSWRREKNELIAQLQSQVDAAAGATRAAESTISALRKESAEAATRIERLAGQVRDAETRLATQEGAFAREMEAMRKLSQLNEQRARDLQAAFEEAEKGLVRAQGDRDAAREAAEKIRGQVEEQVRALESQLGSKTKEAEELRARLAEVDALVGGEIEREATGSSATSLVRASKRHENLGTLSRTAEIAESMRRGGKSFTEIYAEYVTLQTQVTSIRLENTRLQTHIQHILQEVEDRASFYQKQGQDLDTARREMTRLTKELQLRSQRLDQLELERVEMAKKVDRVESNSRADRQEIKDLQRQVQLLLREVEQINPSVPGGIGSPLTGDDDGSIVPSMPDDDLSAADQLISANLVTFRNVRELQARNQQLIRVVRELTTKAEEDEQLRAERMDETVRHQLEEAARRAEEWSAKFAAVEQRIRAVEAERDVFKRMVDNRGSPVGGSRAPPSPTGLQPPGASGTLPVFSSEEQRTLVELQELLQAVREESAKDMSLLKGQIESLRSENLTLMTETKKKEAELKFFQERHQTLQQSFETQQSENQSLRNRFAQSMASAQAQETKSRELATDLIEAKKNVERLRAEVAMLKSEKEVAKSAEARLAQEANSLNVERAKLSELMKQLQNMSADMQRTEGELRRQAERRVQDLETELSDLRKQLAAHVDEYKMMVVTKDREAKELLAKHEKARDDAESLKEKLLGVEGALQKSELRTKELETTADQLRQKIAEQEARRAALDARGDLTDEQTRRRKELELELEETRSQLAAKTEELRAQAEHVQEFKEIGAANERALADLNASYESYRKETETQLSEARERITVLSHDIEVANEARQHGITQLAELRAKSEADFKAWEEEKKALTERVNLLSGYEQTVDSIRASFETDLKRQAALLESTKANYDREVTNHAQAISDLSKAKEELAQAKASLDAFSLRASTAETKLTVAESSWDNQRKALEKSLSDIQGRCTDLEQQNSLLMSQFDTISAQVQRYQVRGPAGGAEAASTELAELRELVRHVKSEKERFQAAAEVKEAEAGRLNVKVEALERERDSLLVMLEQERQSGATSGQSAKEYSELLEKVDQLNLLRESNQTLRGEVQRLGKSLGEAEQKLKELDAEVQPLRSQARELGAERDANQQHIQRLNEEIELWKSRNNQILAKFDRIDPSEHHRLQDEVKAMSANQEALQGRNDELKKQIDALSAQQELKAKELEEVQAKLKNTISRSNDIISKFKDSNAATKQKATTAEARCKDLEKQIEELRGKVAELEGQREQAAGDKQVSAEAAQVLQNLDEAREENKRNQETIDQYKASGQQLNAKLRALEEEKKSILSENVQLKAQAAKLSSDIEAERASITKQVSAKEADVRQETALKYQLLAKTKDRLQEKVLTLQKRVEELEKSGQASATQVSIVPVEPAPAAVDAPSPSAVAAPLAAAAITPAPDATSGQKRTRDVVTPTDFSFAAAATPAAPMDVSPTTAPPPAKRLRPEAAAFTPGSPQPAAVVEAEELAELVAEEHAVDVEMTGEEAVAGEDLAEAEEAEVGEEEVEEGEADEGEIEEEIEHAEEGEGDEDGDEFLDEDFEDSAAHHEHELEGTELEPRAEDESAEEHAKAGDDVAAGAAGEEPAEAAEPAEPAEPVVPTEPAEATEGHVEHGEDELLEGATEPVTPSLPPPAIVEEQEAGEMEEGEFEDIAATEPPHEGTEEPAGAADEVIEAAHEPEPTSASIPQPGSPATGPAQPARRPSAAAGIRRGSPMPSTAKLATPKPATPAPSEGVGSPALKGNASTAAAPKKFTPAPILWTPGPSSAVKRKAEETPESEKTTPAAGKLKMKIGRNVSETLADDVAAMFTVQPAKRRQAPARPETTSTVATPAPAPTSSTAAQGGVATRSLRSASVGATPARGGIPSRGALTPLRGATPAGSTRGAAAAANPALVPPSEPTSTLSTPAARGRGVGKGTPRGRGKGRGA